MAKLKLAQIALNNTENIVVNTHYKKVKSPGQENNMPHMTSPDMSMPLVELINRFASGNPADIGQALYYDGIGHDVEITDDILLGVNWESLDIVDKHNILKQANRDFSRIQEGVKKGQQIKAQEMEEKRKQKDQRDKEFDQWIAQKKVEQEKLVK